MASKNPNAVALGRLGGLKGGKARAAALSREERKRIAQIAAKARWKPIPLECPFCHETNIEVEDLGDNEYAVVCQNCFVCGPIENGRDDAVRRWNGLPPKLPVKRGEDTQ